MVLGKPKMRRVLRLYGDTNRIWVWRAEVCGYVAFAVCPVWAYCTIRELARRGW